MKKLFSNPLFLHSFYGCVVILLLSYIYLTNVPSNVYQELLKTSKQESEVCYNHALSLERDFDRYAQAYRNERNIRASENSQHFFEKSTLISDKLKSIEDDFEKYISNKPLLYQKTSIGTKTYFSNEMIHQLQDDVNNYYYSTLENILDSIEKKDFKKQIDSTHDALFLSNFRTLPSNMALLEIQNIVAEIELWKAKFAMYNLSKNAGCEIKFDKFMVSLIPNTTQIKEGEPFSMDIAAVNYSSLYCNGINATFYVNDKQVLAKDGLGHFETIYNKAGKQSINAEIILKNEFTGEVKSYSKDYTFEVLPK